MQTPHTKQVAAAAIPVFLQELQSVSGSVFESSKQPLGDWMDFADLKALEFQARLSNIKRAALRVTLVSIIALATLAVVLNTPAPQVLCPFAVFLMILFNDWQRNAADTFRFTSLRLAAETLRIIQAVQRKPEQLAIVLSSRLLSTHAVVLLAVKACEASKALLEVKQSETFQQTGDGAWSRWVEEQGNYYAKAAKREQSLGRRARKAFNAAFSFVGFAGLAAGIWSLTVPTAMSSDAFKIWMAVASATGSSGLAFITYVRDKKAFEQSLDYQHMARVITHGGLDSESVLVNESVSEHVRWALRMAGHFEAPPRPNSLA